MFKCIQDFVKASLKSYNDHIANFDPNKKESEKKEEVSSLLGD